MIGKKLKRLAAAAAAAAAVLFAACDMAYVDDAVNSSSVPGGREISEKERDELERSGHFLKLTHMPLNTQVPNVFSVQAANSAAVVGKLNKDGGVCIFRDKEGCTVYMPLVYEDGSDFLETGFFYAAFTVHVDAVAKYVVDLSEKFLVSFTDGRGAADARALPGKFSAGLSYLTVLNLPAHASAQNFSNVAVYNQAGRVAYCADYSLVEISSSGGRASARIPLSYQDGRAAFAETGSYFVSLDINVDVVTRYLVAGSDRVRVHFTGGSGSLDIENIPVNTVPYLTITGLPLNANKSQFSNIAVFNMAGAVASCADVNSIAVFQDFSCSTALIPLSSSSGGGYFFDSGKFAVSFTVNVDVETRISANRADDLFLQFTNGSAYFDAAEGFGFFNAELTGAEFPTIKGGSVFDVDGYRHLVPVNTPVNAYAAPNSCILYLYAFRLGTEVFYEYSPAAPVYNEVKKGFYNGFKRALWKMVFLHEGNRFMFKTYVGGSFPQLENAAVSPAVFDSFTAPLQAYYSLSGAGSPVPSQAALQPGVYAVKIEGAGGGGGYGAVSGSAVSGSSSGGNGGSAVEVFTVQSAVTLTAYAGSGGFAAPAPSPSGTFRVEGYRLDTIYYANGGSSYYIGDVSSVVYSNSLSAVASRAAASGGGGGGGGAGSFLYSAEGGYFLCAGGGGGGSGASLLTPGGAGGSGGAAGPGGGGGAAGYLRQPAGPMTAGGSGGSGGGNGGGSGGQCANLSSNFNGAAGVEILYSNASASGGGGAASHSAGSLKAPLYTLGYQYGQRSSPSRGAAAVWNIAASDFEISGRSGNGGAAAAVSYSAGPNGWLGTNGAGGAGAAAPALNQVSFAYGGYATLSGTEGESLRLLITDLSLSVSFGDANAGVRGSDGGNNRNASKGGGAAGGSVSSSSPSNGGAGSIVIYKIY